MAYLSDSYPLCPAYQGDPPMPQVIHCCSMRPWVTCRDPSWDHCPSWDRPSHPPYLYKRITDSSGSAPAHNATCHFQNISNSCPVSLDLSFGKFCLQEVHGSVREKKNVSGAKDLIDLKNSGGGVRKEGSGGSQYAPAARKGQ